MVYGLLLYFLVPCHLFVSFIIELAAAQQAKGAVARMKKAGEESDTPIAKEKARRSFNTTWRIIAFAHGANSTANLLIAT